jgi:hypothetical protein
MPQKPLLLLAVLTVLVGMAPEVRAQSPGGSLLPKVNPPLVPRPGGPSDSIRLPGYVPDGLRRVGITGDNSGSLGRNQGPDPFGRSSPPGSNRDPLGRDRGADPWNRFPGGGLPPNHPDLGNNRNSFPDPPPRLNPEEFNNIPEIPPGSSFHYPDGAPSSRNSAPPRPWAWTWARKGPPLLVAAGGVLALLAGWWFFGRKQPASGAPRADNPFRA